jgi:tRNA threonylcarbamoyl adenosine modification protein YeaZ
MKILAVEFSSLQRSVAVLNGSAPGTLVSEVVDTSPRGSEALGMIEEALRQAQLEREQIESLAIGLGPGSYTGIRSAIALAQGWELAAGERQIKFIGLSSADCIAAGAQGEGLTGSVAVVIDAQRNEFYLVSYKDGEIAEPLRLASLADVQARAQAGEILIGPEITKWFPAGRLIFPRAATLAKLALYQTEFASAQKLKPIYLRETKFVKAPPIRLLPT